MDLDQARESRMRRLTFLVLVMGSSALSAQEVCGVAGVGYNSLFRNGFEALLQAAKASESEAPRREVSAQKKTSISLGVPMGFAPIVLGGVPTISITSPTSNGAIVGRKLQVRGTITGPINTGVNVNGSPAFVQGNQFVTAEMTLPASGQTTITATATTLDGVTAIDSKMLTAGPGNGLTFSASKRVEFANTPVNFTLSIDPSITIQSVSVDFDGDGTAEFTGSSAALVPTSYTFAQAGIFTGVATVITLPPNSQTLLAKTSVGVIDIVQHRTRVCSVYGSLRARLTANDVAGAIKVFPEENRATYQAYFDALGTNRPTFAGRMGTIATGLLTLTDASMTIITTDQVPPRAYKVRFAQSADGVWRIEDM